MSQRKPKPVAVFINWLRWGAVKTNSGLTQSYTIQYFCELPEIVLLLVRMVKTSPGLTERVTCSMLLRESIPLTAACVTDAVDGFATHGKNVEPSPRSTLKFRSLIRALIGLAAAAGSVHASITFTLLAPAGTVIVKFLLEFEESVLLVYRPASRTLLAFLAFNLPNP